ncbi:hypothetical protein [Streptomyces sp. NPDC048385]|uniref:hypothetical protein n=1 Tax=unclassified Streptomyces TaxID=2593676 RepID=UPI003428DCF8
MAAGIPPACPPRSGDVDRRWVPQDLKGCAAAGPAVRRSRSSVPSYDGRAPDSLRRGAKSPATAAQIP